MSVYLDFNASSPIDERVLDFMVKVYKNSYGNADSRTHDFGDTARKAVEVARRQVAELLAINKDEVFFTSGATESNNIALQGLRGYAQKTGKKHIITSSIEHKAVLESAKHMQEEGFIVDIIDPEPTGRVSVNKIIELVRDDTLLVSIMHINNETGIIQPVEEIGEYLANTETFFHVDATQSFGKLVPELQALKYDMLSMSAHKIGGPQGVGALILRRKNYRLPPVERIMYGGQQEHGIRPGTIPVALVAGLGKACELSLIEYTENADKCRAIRNLLLEQLSQSGVDYSINGDSKYSISSTINLYFPGVSSEALMLSTKQYCGISNGSACNSNSYKPSYVLSAMGLKTDRIEDSVRISWGPNTCMEDVKTAFNSLLSTAKDLAI